jgi:TRAP-type C4-dicarboxylate transport system substrate-binding protein
MKSMVRDLLLGLALTLSFCSGASSQAVTLKAVTAFPENALDSKLFEEWIQKVNSAGQGVIHINYLGGPKAIPTFEVGNAVKTGVIDLALNSGSFYTNVIPEADSLKLAQLPISDIRKNGGMAYINDVWGKKGNMYYLARFKEYTPVHLYLNKKIEKPDLSGLKIRVTPLYRDFFQALGASVITIAPGELYTALERNVVDGYGYTIHGLFDLNWQSQTKYRVDPGFYNAEVGLLLNLSTWNKMSPAARQILEQHGLAHEKKNQQYWTKFNEEEAVRSAKAGMQVITFIGQEREEFLKKAYDVAWEAAIKQSPIIGPKLKEFISTPN